MRSMTWLWMLGAALLFVGCPADDPTDDDDDADDDAADDDDDAADDDDDDGPFSCEDLSDEELALLTKIFCAGSSNSYGNEMSSPPDTADDLSWWYHGKVVDAVMGNLGDCVEYEPELWIYWYSDVDEVPSDATLAWAIDSTFHYLDDNPTEAVFRQRVKDYMETLYGPNGLSDDVVFIGANLPELMMGVTGYTGDTTAILEIIEEEMSAYPNVVVIDLDYYFDKLIIGAITYNGDSIGALDILTDAVHVNELGQQLLADLFIQEINLMWPALKVPQYGTIEID